MIYVPNEKFIYDIHQECLRICNLAGFGIKDPFESAPSDSGKLQLVIPYWNSAVTDGGKALRSCINDLPDWVRLALHDFSYEVVLKFVVQMNKVRCDVDHELNIFYQVCDSLTAYESMKDVVNMARSHGIADAAIVRMISHSINVGLRTGKW